MLHPSTSLWYAKQYSGSNITYLDYILYAHLSMITCAFIVFTYSQVWSIYILIVVFTPHAQRERGKVIGRGVHIYICLWSEKKFESYFRDRLTFSNVDSRTSRRIYRLALLLRAPETLSSLSKSRISIFNAHLTLLVRKMTSHNSIGKYRHLVN